MLIRKLLQYMLWKILKRQLVILYDSWHPVLLWYMTSNHQLMTMEIPSCSSLSSPIDYCCKYIPNMWTDLWRNWWHRRRSRRRRKKNNTTSWRWSPTPFDWWWVLRDGKGKRTRDRGGKAEGGQEGFTQFLPNYLQTVASMYTLLIVFLFFAISMYLSWFLDYTNLVYHKWVEDRYNKWFGAVTDSPLLPRKVHCV